MIIPTSPGWSIYSLYNDALYKIRKLNFTKDYLENKVNIKSEY